MRAQVMDAGHHAVEPRIAGASSLVVFLELNRVLEQNTSTGGPWLNPELRNLIGELASRQGVLVGVMDRRCLPELKPLIEDPRLVYVASEGMEIEGPAFHFVHPEVLQCRAAIDALNQRLSGLPLLYPELSIESKSLTLTLDLSQCPAWASEELATLIGALVPADHADLIATSHGSRFEIGPRIDWGYGHAMQWILGRLKSTDTAIVAVGSDEIVNAVEGTISAQPGSEGPSMGKDPSSEVAALLGWLLDRWQERVEASPTSPEIGRDRPALEIKEASPILNVRLRRAAMGRRRASGG